MERNKVYLDWRSTINVRWRIISFECKQGTFDLADCFLTLGSATEEDSLSSTKNLMVAPL